PFVLVHVGALVAGAIVLVVAAAAVAVLAVLAAGFLAVAVLGTAFLIAEFLAAFAAARLRDGLAVAVALPLALLAGPSPVPRRALGFLPPSRFALVLLTAFALLSLTLRAAVLLILVVVGVLVVAAVVLVLLSAGLRRRVVVPPDERLDVLEDVALRLPCA